MTGRGADEILLGFTRALRAAGVPVTPDRSQVFLAALARLGVDDRDATRTAGRATLCGSPDDLARFDAVFDAYFDPRGTLPRSRPATSSTAPSVVTLQEDEDEELPDDPEDEEAGDEEDQEDVLRAAASAVEVLRHRDVAGMSAAEKRRLEAMFASVSLVPPRRRTARHQRWHRGDLDASRTLRDSLRRLGEPGRIARRRPGWRPRRVVLLIDVSGSMSAYADALLRLANRLTLSARSRGGVVETFTMGTRLTHLTRAMRLADPDRAIAAAGDTVPDWSGGTRLGETVRAFADRWGQRGLARGAVVVIFSDGWERGSTDLLAEQMRRLRRIAHRVVWVNPHRGKPGYEPVQRGVVAALPYCDHFVAGHSLAAFADVAAVIADA